MFNVHPSRRNRVKSPARSISNSDASDAYTVDVEDGEPSFKNVSDSIKVGMIGEAKQLYLQKPRAGFMGPPRWSDVPPELDELEEKTSFNSHDGYAVLVRKRVRDTASKNTLHSIVVQSPLLLKVLRDVLDKYPGITPALSELYLEEPFKPLFHRWDKLLEATKEQTDEETKAHCQVLINIVETELKDQIKTIKELLANEVITFGKLWAIFKPGGYLWLTGDGQPRIVKLLDTSYYHGGMQVNYSYIEYSGSQFGHVHNCLNIPNFHGTKPIKQLSVYPLEWCDDPDGARAKAIERGRLVESLSGVHVKHFCGVADLDEDYGPMYQSLDDRIIIDANAWNFYSQGRALPVIYDLSDNDFYRGQNLQTDNYNHWGYYTQGDLIALAEGCNLTQMRQYNQAPPPMPPPPMPNRPYRHRHRSADPIYDAGINLPPPPPPPRVLPVRSRHRRRMRHGRRRSMSPDSLLDSSENEPQVLTDDQIILINPVVRGFILKSKKWATFKIDDVSDPEWDETAFRNLVMPAEEKELILAFADSQRQDNSRFDDFIAQKGKGCTILLQGPPGTGKTLTAEAVAETIHAPIYSISAGDLGHHASDVQDRLSEILELCGKWNALLLLDEADVFLEQRSANELDRNELVTVFLRLLEYFNGMMFLTTNRVHSFDRAFESRIHVSVTYDPLSEESRRQVWSNFLTRFPEDACSLGDSDLEELSAVQINGRQIKNALKTGMLLAQRADEPLNMQHMRTVLKIIQRRLPTQSKKV